MRDGMVWYVARKWSKDGKANKSFVRCTSERKANIFVEKLSEKRLAIEGNYKEGNTIRNKEGRIDTILYAGSVPEEVFEEAKSKFLEHFEITFGKKNRIVPANMTADEMYRRYNFSRKTQEGFYIQVAAEFCNRYDESSNCDKDEMYDIIFAEFEADASSRVENSEVAC